MISMLYASILTLTLLSLQQVGESVLRFFAASHISLNVW